jgi:hypothetical protein
VEPALVDRDGLGARAAGAVTTAQAVDERPRLLQGDTDLEQGADLRDEPDVDTRVKVKPQK